jgi:hypothetical protein
MLLNIRCSVARLWCQITRTPCRLAQFYGVIKCNYLGDYIYGLCASLHGVRVSRVYYVPNCTVHAYTVTVQYLWV